MAARTARPRRTTTDADAPPRRRRAAPRPTLDEQAVVASIQAALDEIERDTIDVGFPTRHEADTLSDTLRQLGLAHKITVTRTEFRVTMPA